MKVDSTGASMLLQQNEPRSKAHQIQSVFSEILQAAGQRGHASAVAVDSEKLTIEGVQASWDSWFTSERIGGRYASMKSAEELKQGYGKVLARALNEGGYAQPKEFLASLSEEELAVVQKVQSLAEPIGVDSLTEEGALNLLLPAPAQVDLNNDGLTQTGLAYGMRFPDSNTPTAVVEAWEEATAGMDFGQKMIYELKMMLPRMTANMFLNEDGTYSHHHEPGDPEYKNPFADSNYSYVQATEDMLNNLEFVKPLISSEQYARDTEFWSRFQSLLEENEAA